MKQISLGNNHKTRDGTFQMIPSKHFPSARLSIGVYLASDDEIRFEDVFEASSLLRLKSDRILKTHSSELCFRNDLESELPHVLLHLTAFQAVSTEGNPNVGGRIT